MAIPKRVEGRIKDGLKTFGEILVKQRDRDVSEADTVTLVKDILADVFGYEKYTELTGEHSIRGTFCDLAVVLEGKVRFLIEVKAIGLQLAEKHTKQAVDYAANQGVEFVVLTNAIRWVLYHVEFKKPIEQRVVTEFDLLTIDPKSESELERVFLLCREGFQKDAITDYRLRKEATNRFIITALLMNSEDVLNVLRREIRRVSDMLVDRETIVQVLRDEVIKREALEGDRAVDAARRVNRTSERSIVSARTSRNEDEPPAPAHASTDEQDSSPAAQ